MYMRSYDVYRLLKLEIMTATSHIRYYNGGRGVSLSGGLSVEIGDLEKLRAANSAVYRAWLAGCNCPDAERVAKLEAKANKALKLALAAVEMWGVSLAGGLCEIDAQAVADAGAVVLVCHSPGGVDLRVDFSSYFKREGGEE